MSKPSLQDEVNPEIKPGDDFYGFVNDKWCSTNPIPDNKSRYGAFTALNDQNIERLREQLEQPDDATQLPNLKNLKTLYRSGMDEAAIEANGIAAINVILGEIKNISSAEELKSFIMKQHSGGLGLVWGPSVEPDDKNSQRYIFRLHQSGLGLPDRDYYFEDGEKFGIARQKYQEFLVQLLQLLGIEGGSQMAEAILGLESQLAEASATATERRDDEAMYNSFSIDKLETDFPEWGWADYLDLIGLDQVDEIIISQPKFFAAALQQMSNQSLQVWRSYLAAQIVMPLMKLLPKDYVDLSFNFFGRTLQGSKELEPRYRRVIGLSQSLLPEPMGQLFVDKYFDDAAKATIQELVGHLLQAFRLRLEKVSWMSDDTKAKALEKLSTFLPLLGYPDKWRDYNGLEIGHNYAANYLAVAKFEWERETGRIDQQVDRQEWLMSPADVNAYYWPSTNGITFPAGILQPPFFDPSGDIAANYGGIGIIIGHEITHGFDDAGAKFDKNGNLKPWWSEADEKAFMERAKVIVEQFNNFQVEGRHVNGKLTLGENIADLGGVAMAFDALQAKLEESSNRPNIDGFSPEQRFFMSYARIWRENRRSELALQCLVTDPHSPNMFRVNGPIVNLESFYKVFELTSDDKAFISAEKRAMIW